MTTSFSPITDKVYQALIKIDVTCNTIEEAKRVYTHGILSIADCSSNQTTDDADKSMFESYNLAYEERFVSFIKKVFEMNSDKTVLVETNIQELDNVTLMRILTILDYRDKLLFLDMIRNTVKSTFVARDVKILEMLMKLATRNLLFSTFHFLSKEVTICCQPDLTFPIFISDFEMLETYLEIASSYNLKISDLQIKY